MTWNRCFEDRFIPGVQWVVEDSTVLLRNSKVSTNTVVLLHGDARDVLPNAHLLSNYYAEELKSQLQQLGRHLIKDSACAMGPRLYHGGISMSMWTLLLG